jgi:ribonuclease HI
MMPNDDTGRTTVYTDGACHGNPGPGGWAWAIPGQRGRSGYAPRTTNQRMEIQAALDAIQAVPGPLLVVSDSTYVVNCITHRWYAGWLRKGWRNVAGRPVANQDLWRPFVTLITADPQQYRFRWVKGHSADPFNQLVDTLATEACLAQKAWEGDLTSVPSRPASPGRPWSGYR